MNIIEINDLLEEFVKKYGFYDDALAMKKECAVSSSSEWKSVLDEFEESGRVLRIGVVGRVKAGKSSMLNALLFDGLDVLPKAATPMTAALTIIKYSNEIRAEVDFYTSEDIDDIKQRHGTYKKKLKALIGQYTEDFKNLTLRKKKKGASGISIGIDLNSNEIAECEDKAKKQAEREMASDPNHASFDQYTRIEKSGKRIESLEDFKVIQADSVESLMSDKLLSFVGSRGEFMPFTKSVTLHIPHPGLEGLEIIDTPGINDPVTSRGERTEELLQHCDVVLVVSPSGQFLSEEDTTLLHRITTKEGTQEAYLIASQVDNQLFGSEKGNSTDPDEVLGRVTRSLTNHARTVLQRFAQDNPEMIVATAKLEKNDVICSSSAAYTLDRYYDDRSSWDGNLQHVFKNLLNSYPEAFGDKEEAKEALRKLANIGQLQNVISEVSSRKKDILQQRRIDFENGKHKALQNYLEMLSDRNQERIKQIETADVAELRRQEKELSEQHATVSQELDEIYDDLIVDVQLNLDREMKASLAKEMRQFHSASDGAQGTKQESKEVYRGRGGFLWLSKRYETQYYDVNTVKTSAIRKAIENVRNELEDSLSHIAIVFQVEWKKSIYKKVIGCLRKTMGDDALDISTITRSVKNIMARIPEADFSIDNKLPKELKKTGTLTSEEADEFVAAATEFALSMNERIRVEIKSFVNGLVASLKQVALADDLLNHIDGELKQLVSDIDNKQASLFKYESISKKIDELRVKLT